MALLGVLPIWELHRPVGVLTVEIAVRIHHLRLDPDAEVHPQRVHLLDHRLQAVGKLLLVEVPVAQAAVIVVALTKPAIINHKSPTPSLAAFSARAICVWSIKVISVASHELKMM